MTALIYPQWQQPNNVRSCSTLRTGGVSLPPFDSFNLGTHVEDEIQAVMQNRAILRDVAKLPNEPYWLTQIHGTNVLRLEGQNINDSDLEADAVYTNIAGQVCAIMTADCLPVLFCHQAGNQVAAAHAGWRGLCAGVLENTIAQFTGNVADIIAWLGPAIGPKQFEVGTEVREAFLAQDSESHIAFKPHADKYLADIYLLAKLRLAKLGIKAVYGGESCTFNESQRYFSYRRDKKTGRMASLVWFES